MTATQSAKSWLLAVALGLMAHVMLLASSAVAAPATAPAKALSDTHASASLTCSQAKRQVRRAGKKLRRAKGTAQKARGKAAKRKARKRLAAKKRAFRKAKRARAAACKGSGSPNQPPTTSPTGPPGSGNLKQQILDDTYELTVKFGEELANGNHGSLPYWYKYSVDRADCVLLSGDTGRCLIYLWQRAYAAGYGYGGYEESIWRDYYIATHVGERLYEPKIIQIDFLDPYMWVCSDNPAYGVSPCS